MFRRCVVRWAAASSSTSSASGPFDPYKILGVRPNATQDEVKKAYHRLALRFHPDGGPEGNTARFQAVQEAYEALKSGTWKPPQASDDKGDGNSTSSSSWAGGRRYVYEEPGSTTENYVASDKRLQTQMKLVLAWCVGFVLLRMWLLRVFPHNNSGRRLREGTEPSLDAFTDSAPATVTTSPSAPPPSPRSTSVHQSDDQDPWQRAKSNTARPFRDSPSGGSDVFVFGTDEGSRTAGGGAAQERVPR